MLRKLLLLALLSASLLAPISDIRGQAQLASQPEPDSKSAMVYTAKDRYRSACDPVSSRIEPD